MVRPKKIGLDYFPMDVDMDQDDKIYLVKADHGWEGFAIVVKLLMEVYKEGYYIEWDEKKAKIFSRKNLFDLDVVNDVINTCLEEGLFNNNLFEEHQILTSKGIQTRYVEATTRRKNVLIYKEFFLIDVNELPNNNLTLVNVCINHNSTNENDDISTQSKVKESKEKVKESKAEEIEEPAADDAIVFYQENFGVIRPAMSEILLAWIKDSGEAMVIKAMDKTLKQNKSSWSYVEGILRKWNEKGIDTIEKVEAEEVEFLNQQNQYKNNKPKENVPDWFVEQKKKQQEQEKPKQQEQGEDVAIMLENYKKNKASGDGP
ncbi:Lin1244/Lin1753 domain-containing protein [Aquibacillus rhizosphaerae]|uniref:DUF4373 domain-containing protein n=1 Tax=Aquibacillus rhizosphaerae TaxID=3051431 RepID=A0ABT7LBM6_9BACI|nr:Lin1244/Lin1753 domain-containing protein [Aquibacillus sp. LR5S19]MDL4842809.1 DUF4373 domain-containing protein [Aquibacillus sp. LR5S19]